MKKKLLLLCMMFLSIFGTHATTQTPTNSTVAGVDTWYFIKGTARTNTTQKVEWLTGAPTGFNVNLLPFHAGDAQRWKVVTNGAGLALVNKAYGNYLNTDMIAGQSNPRIYTVASAPTTALKFVPTTQVTNGVLPLSLNTTVGASPGFTVTATDANLVFGILTSGLVYQPILGGGTGANYNIIFYSESEKLVLTELTAAATLLYNNTSFSNRQASSKTALNTANTAAATVRDNASSTAAQNLTAINNLSAAILAYNAATYTTLTVSSADASNEKWYLLKGQVTANTYATSSGAGAGVTSSVLASTLPNSGLQLWKIVPNGTAGYALKNKATGEYLNTDLGFLSGNPTDVAITTKAAAPTNSVVFNVSTATGAPTNSVWIENINAYPGLLHNYFRLNDGTSSTVRDVVNATTNVSWLLVDLKGDLNSAIATATSYLPSTASLNPGNGTASAQATLTTAISTATTVYNNASSTNSDLLNATTTLNTALTTYKAAIITPTISSADASNEKWYFFQGLRPTNSYMTTNGIGQGITSVTVIPDDTQLWKIVPNTNSPGTGYALVNKANGGYMNTDVTNGTNNAQATTISTMPLINVVFNQSDVLTNGVARFWVENAGTTSASSSGFTFRLHAGITNVLNWWGNRYDNSTWLLMDYSVSLKGFLNTAITAANVVVNDATIPVGTALGQYPSDAKPTLTTAIATAQAVYDNASATDAAVQAAIANLNTAVFICKGRRGDAVVSTAGTPRWFVIRNLLRTDANLVLNQVITTNGVAENGNMKYETQANVNEQLWRFEASATGGVKIINAAKPTLGIQKFTYNNPQKLVAIANASGYVIDILGSGYQLTDDLGNPLHAYNGNLITYSYSNNAGTASNWAIEERALFLPQTITFATTATATYGDVDFSPGATSSTSGVIPITYTSSNTAVATIVAGQIHIVGAGQTTITASQASNTTYLAAANVQQVLTVSPLALTVSNAAAQNKVYDAGNAAVITGTLSGIINSDAVTLTGTGTFADVNIANGIAVTSTSTLGGAKAGNYTLTQPTGLTANIIPTTSTWTGNGNWSDASKWTDSPLAGSQITVSSGELTIDQDANIQSITVSPGAKLTLPTGKALVSSSLTLKSSNTGTATFLDNGTSTITTATVEQYLTSGRNWYTAVPVTSAGVSALNGTSVVMYNEANATWDDAGATMNPLRGYISVNTASTGAIAFSGTLNTGNKSIGLTRLGATKSGFNLVGNPYPSYLDWSLVSAANPDVMTTIWYRTKAADNSYTFDTYNASGNVATSLGATPVSSYIPPMQAYWVRVNEGLTGTTFNVTNNMRKHADASTNLLKVSASTKAVQQLLRLNVSNGVNTDEALVYFNDNASNGYDVFDSPKMTNGNAAIPEIYTLAGTEHLVINGLKNVPLNEEIPLGFSTGTSNTFTIKATEFKDFATDTKVILKDKLLNKEQDLSAGVDYSFSSDITAANNTRFALIFKTTSIATGFVDVTAGVNPLVYVNTDNQIVVTNTVADETGSVLVYNSVGQKVYTQKLQNSSTVLNYQLQQGVYLIAVTNAGRTVGSKIAIH